MEELNKLEIEILKSIIDENKEKYPDLLIDLKIIKVKNREYTGVGSYTNFEYIVPTKRIFKDTSLSSQKSLMIEGLEYNLSYEIALTNGKIDFLEIVTNGDELWDGKANNFKLK